MPYVVIKFNDQELDRRELTGELVIGRAPECGVAVRDILLSRRHCFLEEGPTGWLVTDLNSKNGTFVNGEKLIGSRLLQDVDVVRMGRSKVIFHAGIPDESVEQRLMAPQRPLDPSDSLSGTLSGFTLLLPGEGETPSHLPCPRPTPRQPTAYESPEVQVMLTALASSSWDSIYAEARQPRRDRPATAADSAPAAARATARPARPRSPIDFSLQANPSPAAIAEHSAENSADAQPRPPRFGRIKRWIRAPRRLSRISHFSPQNLRQTYRRELPILAGAVWLAAGLMIVHDWPLLRWPARHQEVPAYEQAVTASAREPAAVATRPPRSFVQEAPQIIQPSRSISDILELNVTRDVQFPIDLSRMANWPIKGPFRPDLEKDARRLMSKDAVAFIPNLLW
jgi:pSer/pThr/pTyr-binding forkhead associated (FHA) protein